MEYDLITLDCRLRDFETDPRGPLSWRDLVVIVRQSPPSSALAHALDPQGTAWTPEAHLLASVIDVLSVANWQRSNGKGPRPKPIKRPGLVDPDTESIGRDPLPVDEMAEWLGGAFADAA